MNGMEVDRPLRRAAARGRRVPRRPRPAQARRRVPALHPGAARDRLSALPGADAVDAGRAAPARQERADPGHRHPDRAARHDAATRLSAADDATACEFRTAHDVTLLPVEVVSATLFLVRPRSAAQRPAARASAIKGGLRIRLKTTAGLKFDQTDHRPAVLLSGGARRRRQQAATSCAWPPASACWCGRSAARSAARCRCCRRRRSGRSASPTTRRCCRSRVRSFQGYRLLQEYFAFPQRYRFFELSGLAASARPGRTGTSSSSWSCSAAAMPTLEGGRRSRRTCAVLHAGDQPVREARIDRIHVNDSAYEYPRRRRPDAADGLRDLPGDRASSATAPATTASSSSCRSTRRRAATSQRQQSAYFTTRREPRLMSGGSAKRRGARSSYIGSEVFLSLVDANAGAVSRRPAAAVDPARCAPIATWCCRCRSVSARATSRSTSPRR